MSFLCAEWFTTAYARNTPLPLALCAFDLIFVRLEDIMIRLGLAILEVAQEMRQSYRSVLRRGVSLLGLRVYLPRIIREDELKVVYHHEKAGYNVHM